MSSLLTKIALQKAIGVCLDEHEITVSKVAFTPTGPVEIASASELYTSENLPETLEKLLVPLLGKKHHAPVAVGLSSSRLFYGTRIVIGSSEPTAEAMLHKALCSPTISVEDLTADMMTGTIQKTPVASLVACRKKYMAGIVSALDELGIRPVRAEPSPCALVRTAVSQKKYPRRAKISLCVFLGEEQGLAAIVSSGRPLAWKKFPLVAGSEGMAVVSAARTLQTQGKNYGVDSLEYAVIHGRPDLHEGLNESQLPTQLGVRVVWQEGPAYSGAAMAFGIAAGCLEGDAKAFDLSRQMKARPSILDIFPWWDFSYAALLVAWLGLTLFAHKVKLQEDYLAVRMQSSSHESLVSGDSKDLAKKTEYLEKKVEAVYKYLDSRMLWTDYTRDIADRLPKEAVLSTFTGEWIMVSGRKKSRREKKSLLFRAGVPQQDDGSTPLAIDEYLKELRNDPLLKEKFGMIELTDIKRSLSRDRKTSVAAFTILCLPGKKK